MTVEGSEDGKIDCVWADRQGRVRRDNFPVAVLSRSHVEFDGIGDLVIEGVTHTKREIDAMYGDAGNA